MHTETQYTVKSFFMLIPFKMESKKDEGVVIAAEVGRREGNKGLHLHTIAPIHRSTGFDNRVDSSQICI
jgi:hypothetical protein